MSARAEARLARIAGALLLVMAAAAMFAELGVRSNLVVPGDAELTASRILGAPHLFRLGLLGYLVAFACDVPVAVLFYVLLRPVDRTHALLATAFRLVYAAVVGAALFAYLGALLLLSDAAAFSAFEPRQLHALALLFLELFGHGFGLALVFFGLHLALLGTLLFRSRRLPRVFGVLLTLGGAAYVIDNLMRFVVPALQAKVGPFLAALAMSELALAAWLVAKGMSAASTEPLRRAARSV